MVVLGLGSNCDDRLSYLRRAIQFLKSPNRFPHLTVLAISPIYQSEALLPESAPEAWNQPFLNLNILCETSLSPLDLLKQIKNIESMIGRKDRGRWAPREIDIDILTWDHHVFHANGLEIPHPSLMERPFALLPLADLCPNWKSPSPQFHSVGTVSELVAPWRRMPAAQVPYQTRRSSFHLGEVVGILNITPDSFSDGGAFLEADHAIRRAFEMTTQGVTVLDIGAESTRPGAANIGAEDEWLRLEPVLKKLQSSALESPAPIRISIDTRHPETAKKAIRNGVHWINDVTGFSDPEMRKTVADSDVDVVIMHSLSVPPLKSKVLPAAFDPVDQILEWAHRRIQELSQVGIHSERIIFDPGIGFGKTNEQTWEIFRNVNRFQDLGVRILVGHSRKSFLSELTQRSFAERDVETVILSVEMAKKGIDYLRVHNVESNLRALKTWTQVNGVIRCNERKHLTGKRSLIQK